MKICPHCKRPIPIAYHKTSAGIVMRIEACKCLHEKRVAHKRLAFCVMAGAIVGGLASAPAGWMAVATAGPVFAAGLAWRLWASRPLRA